MSEKKKSKVNYMMKKFFRFNNFTFFGDSLADIINMTWAKTNDK